MTGNIVLRKIGLLFTAAACGALVTSCGDDDTPDPLPTETATPDPTPTPTQGALNFDFASEFSANTANASFIYAFFTPDGSDTEVFSDASRINGTTLLSYELSPETVTFTYPDLSDAVLFTADDLASFVTTPSVQRTYTRGDESLTLQVPFQHVLRANYQRSNQDFTLDEVDGTLRSNRVSLFFNRVTTEAAISGNLSYTGGTLVVGGDPGVTEAGTISSPETTFTVTDGASADTISGTIRIFENDGSNSVLVATLNISDTLSASGAFDGTVEDDANGLTGTYAGVLAGPNREELILVFSVVDDDADDDVLTEYTGNFIGN